MRKEVPLEQRYGTISNLVVLQLYNNLATNEISSDVPYYAERYFQSNHSTNLVQKNKLALNISGAIAKFLNTSSN